MTLLHRQSVKIRGRTGGGHSAISSSSLRVRAGWLGGLVRRAWQRSRVVFYLVHQAIVIAKTRRLTRELMFHPASRYEGFLLPDANESRDSDREAAKFPRLPLMIGDKWDF